jgi:hypothetical protein
MTKVLLNTINLQAPTQLRMMGESQLHIEDLAMSYVETGKFRELPKVGLIKGDKILVPIDGFHRLHAVKWLASDDFKTFPDAPDVSHLDLTIVEVEIVEFNTIGEAIIAASGVNSDHGMKRKAGDIGTAIAAILEVEPMMFMENKYKLNQRVIMETVKCSAASYRRETAKIREDYKNTRDTKIVELHEAGRSLRDIAGIVGIHHSTVEQLVGVGKCSVSEIRQEEPSENTGDNKCSVSESYQQEEPLSAFVHATSVDPILNPFGDEVSSQRDIAGIVGISPMGVNTVLGVHKCSVSESVHQEETTETTGDNNNPSVKSYQQEETSETTGGENYPCVKIPQEEPVRYVRTSQAPVT